MIQIARIVRMGQVPFIDTYRYSAPVIPRIDGIDGGRSAGMHFVEGDRKDFGLSPVRHGVQHRQRADIVHV